MQIDQSREGSQGSLGPTFLYRWGNETKSPRGDGTGPRCQGIFWQNENRHSGLLAPGPKLFQLPPELGMAGTVEGAV